MIRTIENKTILNQTYPQQSSFTYIDGGNHVYNYYICNIEEKTFFFLIFKLKTIEEFQTTTKLLLFVCIYVSYYFLIYLNKLTLFLKQLV